MDGPAERVPPIHNHNLLPAAASSVRFIHNLRFFCVARVCGCAKLFHSFELKRDARAHKTPMRMCGPIILRLLSSRRQRRRRRQPQEPRTHQIATTLIERNSHSHRVLTSVRTSKTTLLQLLFNHIAHRATRNGSWFILIVLSMCVECVCVCGFFSYTAQVVLSGDDNDDDDSEEC